MDKDIFTFVHLYEWKKTQSFFPPKQFVAKLETKYHHEMNNPSPPAFKKYIST